MSITTVFSGPPSLRCSRQRRLTCSGAVRAERRTGPKGISQKRKRTQVRGAETRLFEAQRAPAGLLIAITVNNLPRGQRIDPLPKRTWELCFADYALRRLHSEKRLFNYFACGFEGFRRVGFDIGLCWGIRVEQILIISNNRSSFKLRVWRLSKVISLLIIYF